MLPYQKSIGNNKLENLLFPLHYLDISQGENGGYSHQDSLAVDFIGKDANGRVYRCPYYAPCDLELVHIFGSASPMLIWESVNQVNFADGSVDYFTIGFAHDNDIPNFEVGETRNQGDPIGKTGTYGNVTGDHVHIEVAKGNYAGMYENSYGWNLRNQYHVYNALAVNDTILIDDYNYAWKLLTEFKLNGFRHVLISGALQNFNGKGNTHERF